MWCYDELWLCLQDMWCCVNVMIVVLSWLRCDWCCGCRFCPGSCTGRTGAPGPRSRSRGWTAWTGRFWWPATSSGPTASRWVRGRGGSGGGELIHDLIIPPAWSALPSGWIIYRRCLLDRSAYQPTQWTVATGRLIYPPYIWVDTPTCDVKKHRNSETAWKG